MKKILALLLAVMMLFCLVACGGNDTPSEPVSKRSIPKAASTETTLTSTKFTIDCNHTNEAWSKGALPGYCFIFNGMYANSGRSIRASFLGTLADGQTIADIQAVYKADKAVNFTKQTWDEPTKTTIAGYDTTVYRVFMGRKGVSNGQEFYCYFIDVDGEVFLIELVQDDRTDSALTPHEMDTVNALLKDVVITPIA